MMTPKPAPKTTKPKAQPTAHDPVIEVPPDRQLETVFGFMQAAGSPPVDLVRLATVLRWIETTKKIPRLPALTALCDAMPEDIINWLFWVKKNDYADKVPIDAYVYYMTDSHKENEERRRFMAKWCELYPHNHVIGERESADIRSKVIPVDTTPEPCFEALVNTINRVWEFIEEDVPMERYLAGQIYQGNVSCLSIPLSKAAEIWGYGKMINVVESTPVNFVELVKYRKENEGAAWIDSHIEILRSESVIRQGRPSYRKKLADELGISTARIGQLLHQNRAKPMRANAPNLRKVA